MNQVISYGAGVNSTAMAIMLINQGWRGHIVFSDTGCEWPETYCYMDYFESEWLKPRGFEIIRLKGLPYQNKREGISLIDYCETRHVIPFAAVRWCTMEWKVEPMKRWGADNDNPKSLIGIAADESQRRPDANRPLVNAGITREGCIKIIETEGLSVPQKSGCYICPFQRPKTWRELWRNHPELFERVAKIEESIPVKASIGWAKRLDPDGKVSLRDRQDSFERQIPLFDSVDYDDLLRFKPCMCEVG